MYWKTFDLIIAQIHIINNANLAIYFNMLEIKHIFAILLNYISFLLFLVQTTFNTYLMLSYHITQFISYLTDDYQIANLIQ